MATSDAPNTRRLARQLVDVTRRLKHLETVPQLSNSSLDNQGMHVYDADGNVSVTLGKQEDGTYSARPVAGPIPPAPVGLDAEGDAGLIRASWQGAFWAGAAMPRDFEAVEVLVDGNVQGAIHNPDGGSVAVPAFAGERVVSFRTLSQAGRYSGAIGDIAVTVQSKASVQLDEARGRIDEAKADSAEALVRAGEAEATAEAVQGGLDTLETVTLPGAVAELEAADVAVQQAVAGLEGDVSAVQGVANAAQDAATQAASDAAAAAQDAADAAGLAASKGDVLIQSAAPAAEMRKASTLWIDTTGGANTPKRWDGAAWIAVTDRATVDAANLAAQAKAAADDAQTAADDAQTTATNAATAAGAAQSTATEALTSANGKSKITRSTSNPPAQYGGRVDDLWWVLSSLGSGGRVLSQWRWNSNVWVSERVGGEVIANLDAAKITSGFVDAARIEAGSLTADKLLIGDFSNLVDDPAMTGPGWSSDLPFQFRYTSQGPGNAIYYAGEASGWVDNSNRFPVMPGDKIRITGRLQNRREGDMHLVLSWYTHNGSGSSETLFSGVRYPSPGKAFIWTDVEDTVTAPSDARFAVLRVGFGSGGNGGAYMIRPVVRRMTGSTLIEDGAVATGKLLAGAVTTEKLTVTDTMSAAIVDAMSVNTKKLVVSEEAILNHATLIGQTVVDDINVQGKLIGTDGVFTGTVDFENVNVTGLQLVERLEANSISADKIEGGAFTGETFTGGEFVGGSFRTSDNLPGQVRMSDTAVEGVPGVQVVPADTTGYTSFPGVTHSHTGMMMWGGRDTTDRESEATLRPDRVYLRSLGGGDPTSEADILVTEGIVRLRSIPDASDPLGYGVRVTLDDRALNIDTRSDTGSSSINVLGTNARIANGAPDGRYAEINTDWASARVVREAAGGTRRALVVDDHGVWAETDRDGTQMRYNLEETAQDSGWAMATVASGHTAQPGYPPKARKVGNLVYLSGGVSGAGIGADTSQYVLTLPPGYRPVGNSIYVVGGSSTGAACPLFVIQPDGRVSLRTTATTGSYYLMDGLSFIPE